MQKAISTDKTMMEQVDEAILTLQEVERFALSLSAFFARLRATVVESERAQQIEARLARAGLILSSDGRVVAGSSKPNGTANGSNNNPSVHRPVPVKPAAIIRAVRNAGEPGATASQIADELHADVSRVRPVLWQVRDAGKLRATGKLSTTRYHLPKSAPKKMATPASKQTAPKTGPKKTGSGKKVKPANKSDVGKKSAPSRAAKPAAAPQTEKTASPS